MDEQERELRLRMSHHVEDPETHELEVEARIMSSNPFLEDIAENAQVLGHEDPERCHCRGGWWLTNFDTWERCRWHHVGQPHPECEVCPECSSPSLREGAGRGCATCVEELVALEDHERREEADRVAALAALAAAEEAGEILF